MHAHLTPVTTTSDSRRSADLDDACPGRPALASTSAPAAVSSPAAAFSSTGRSPFSTAPAVEASSFNVVPDRRGTASLKWDFAVERGRPEGVLPLWVADMDHATAPAPAASSGTSPSSAAAPPPPCPCGWRTWTTPLRPA